MMTSSPAVAVRTGSPQAVTNSPASPGARGRSPAPALTSHRIIHAAQLRAGPATIIVALGDRTIRSRAVMVIAEPHGIVRVAFDSGDIRTAIAQKRSLLGPVLKKPKCGNGL
jgi:hypothetical protein